MKTFIYFVLILLAVEATAQQVISDLSVLIDPQLTEISFYKPSMDQGNANDAIGANLFNEQGSAAASIEIYHTNGEAYDRPRFSSERFDGELQEIAKFFCEGKNFISGNLFNHDGSVKHAVYFSAYFKDNYFAIESRWAADHMPQGEDIYNFIVQSTDQNELYTLVKSCLSQLHTIAELKSFYCKEEPEVFFASGNILPNNINFEIMNTNIEQQTNIIVSSLDEGGNIILNQSEMLRPGYNLVPVTIPGSGTFIIKTQNQDGETTDEVLVTTRKETVREEMVVFPNPIRTQGQVEFTSGATGYGWMMISDLTGRQIKREVVMIAKGQNLLNVDLPQNMYPGMYVIGIMDPAQNLHSTKVNVQ